MKKLLMLLGTAMFLHQGSGENESIENDAPESDEQSENTSVSAEEAEVPVDETVDASDPVDDASGQ